MERVSRETEKMLQWRQWLLTRPPIIQELARKYPPHLRFNLHGRIMHVMGYNEDGGLILTPINPEVNYEEAIAKREPLCPCCLEKLDQLIVRDENN